MITINYRDPRPIYEQIQTELRRLMLSGVLPPGSRLPSVRELAGQLAINPNTIQRAYRELEADGYILSVAGKGSFVAQVDQLAEQQKKQAVDAFRAAAQKLPSRIRWEMTGPMPNEKLMRWYAEHPVSCLVNVSSSEGLPVALMEACSFGFPCVATEVGGTPEAVRDGVTGYLLGRNPSPQEIAASLEKLAQLPEEEYRSMCRAARRLWEDKFNAEKNYARFYEDLTRPLDGAGEENTR